MDGSRLKIAEKARQIGWTWATAYSLVRRKALRGARADAWISSRDDLQARLFLEDCKHFAAILDLGAKDLGERAVDDSGHSAYVLQFASGLRIHSMSSNPDAQAGKRGDRVLDEFALHPDPRKLYAIAYYGITWGGQLEIFSTHRGASNFFNQLIQEIRYKGNPKGFSLHRVTLQDALEQGFLWKLQSKLPENDPRQALDEAGYYDLIRAESPDEETFLQECMCIPADESTSFITYEMLDACKYPLQVQWELNDEELALQKNLFLGVDIGRRHDLTVIWVLEKNAVLLTRRVIELRKCPFDEQEAVLYKLLDMKSVRRACIDETGIGMQFVERAKKRYGKHRVEGIQFSLHVKEDLAFSLRTAMESGDIRIPDRRDIIADFRSIRKETTSAGNLRFVSERSSDGHADRFWACALAVHAAHAMNGVIDADVAHTSIHQVRDMWQQAESNRMELYPRRDEELINPLLHA